MVGAGDTICALASGAPPSAVAIIRLSGPATARAVETLAGSLPSPRRASLRALRAADGVVIDRGLVLWMPGPQSYTGEDSAELHLHGGSGVIERTLAALCASPDVRLAEPGEFTRRAFENGKLDLVQAEAVADLIDAETEAQAAQAVRQLDGELSAVYAQWRDGLIGVLALLEAMIDFPDEEDAPSDAGADIAHRLDALIEEMRASLGDGGVGERLRDGFRVALVGPPNAGKSTLLNRLAGRDMAIVTDRPGTTRDVLEARLKIGGAIVWLIDTAGVRATEDEIEAEGVRRAERAARGADLRLHLVDGAVGPDRDLIDRFHVDGDMVLIAKSDLSGGRVGIEGLRVSAKTGHGLDELTSDLVDWTARQAKRAEASVITRARHRQAVANALDGLESAKSGLNRGIGAELAAEDVRRAAQSVAGLLGKVGVEDVLDAVFSSFCIGK